MIRHLRGQMFAKRTHRDEIVQATGIYLEGQF